MKLTYKRAVALAAAALGALSLLTVSADAAVDAGIPVIIDPKTNEPIPGGGSLTVWTWKMPRPPADYCTGDSATKGYFVYGYITPVANNPLALTFNPSTGVDMPAGSWAYPLFDTSGSPYISKNTAPTTGQLKDFPGVQFDWSRFSIDGRPDLRGDDTIPTPAGVYNTGLACWDANNRRTDKVWNTRVEFVASSTDRAGEVFKTIAFTAPGAPRNLTAAPGAVDADGLFSVDLAWEAPATDGGKTVSSYQVFRSTTEGGPQTRIATVPATRRTYVDSKHTLDVVQRYHYTVKAVNSIGASPASNTANAKASPWNLVPVG